MLLIVQTELGRYPPFIRGKQVCSNELERASLLLLALWVGGSLPLPGRALQTVAPFGP